MFKLKSGHQIIAKGLSDKDSLKQSKQENYCEYSEIKNWEDEGGAYIDRSHDILRSRRVS